ncbi:MAG: hypothetical protein JO166_14915 [Deltaproteobacteria bacterium]|nr:hypothetical protein [Deltaproteobacteria bacterium]
MNWQLWLLFIRTDAVLSVPPTGYTVRLSHALARGPHKSLWASWGILAASAAGCLLIGPGLGLARLNPS